MSVLGSVVKSSWDTTQGKRRHEFPLVLRSAEPYSISGCNLLYLGLMVILACGFALAQDNPVVLEPGKVFEDTLAPEQTKSFPITLSAGQYAAFTAQTGGLRAMARLFNPVGKEELQSWAKSSTQITISVLASSSGTYRIELQRFGNVGGDGHYKASLSGPRMPSPEDTKRFTAQSAFAEGERLVSDRSNAGLKARLPKYETALALWRELGNRPDEAQVLMMIGTVYGDLHEADKSVEYLKEALSISQAGGSRYIEADCAQTLGAVYANRGEKPKAVEYFKQALAASREKQYDSGEAMALMSLGRNDPSVDALEYFQRALVLWRGIEDRRGEAYALNTLGQKYMSLGKQREGMETIRQSLELGRAMKDQYAEAYALQHLGEGYAMQGDLRKALEQYLLALPLQRARGDAWGETQALASIGLMYMSLGEIDKALEYSRQALPYWQKIKNGEQEADTLVRIGKEYSGLGDTETALSHFQRALVLYRAAPDQAGEADALAAMGETHVQQRKLQDALQDYNQALVIYLTAASSAASLRLGEAIVRRDLGSVQVALGQTEEALKSLNLSLEILHATGHSVEDEASILYELARAQRAGNRLQEALASAQTAIDLTERVRGTVAGADVRASYVAKVRGRYEFLIAVLMQLHQRNPTEGYDAKALEASEKARARSLLDLLSESHAADIRQGLDPALLETERSLQAQLSFKAAYRLQLLSTKHTDQQAGDLEKEINALASQYEENQQQIRARSPHYASLTQPQPLTRAEIQNLLDSDTVLLEYSLGADASFLWAVTQDTLTSYRLPKRAEIESLARQAYEEVSVNDPAGSQAAMVALGHMLLAPVQKLLTHKRLAIIAEGALAYIPVAALRASSQSAPLVAEHEIVNLPSASTLSLLRKEMEGRPPAPRQVAAIADPVFSSNDPRVSGGEVAASPGANAVERSVDVERSAKETGMLSLDRLPATRREAQTIVALSSQSGSMQALDFDASRETAMSPELGQYRIIHFASHTLLNSRHPQLSGIVLSMVDKKGQPRDGFLQVHEIFNLKLNADLVVLSACETALGKEVRGEGLVGLTRAFMYAGTPRVVASLWRVPDHATSELMRRFYQNMLSGGMTPSVALRRAQVALLREKRWSAPYYWAGFLLQGEWK